jgi:acetyltransferase
MAQGANDVATAIAELRRRTTKAICVSWMFAPADAIDILKRAGLHVFPEPACAIRALAQATHYNVAREVHTQANAIPVVAMPFDWDAHVPHPHPGTIVTEDACHRILAASGLPIARARLAASEDDALEAARDVGLPVVMKGISKAVTHRAAAGLLALDVRTEADVRDAFRRLAARADALKVTLDGVYVQRLAGGKLELLVSAFRDPVFGVMVVCGAGGTLTEVIDDVVLARAPLDASAADALLRRLRVVARAPRIDPDARLAPVADFVSRFSQLVASAPWRRFVIEVNPIKWDRDDVTAIDGLIVIDEA